MKVKFLAAKVAVAVVVALGGVTAMAQWAVIDATNLSQNIMAAQEAIAQTMKQIEQYKTQLEQYENQLRNTVAPAVYIWDQVQNTIDQLLEAQKTLEYYQEQFGSLDNYLARFKDLDAYRNSPCYSAKGCTQAQWDIMKQDMDDVRSDALKKEQDTIKNAFKSIEIQQKNIKQNAQQLTKLQQQAQNANGRMQALAAANQLAAHQSNQLMQIHALLISQQQLIIDRNNFIAEVERQQHEADRNALKGKFVPSKPMQW